MTRNDIETIHRRRAASGKVSYGDTVALHETSKTRITFTPFFVPHSDHTELAVKITTYHKGEEPFGWVLNSDKTISLNEGPARELLKCLQSHLVVAGESGDGNFLLLRISEGTADLGDHDPALVANALTKVLAQEDIVNHLQGAELSDELIRSLRGAIHLKEMRSAVLVLRASLDGGVTDERHYQEWCSTHSWAFGSAYVVNDDIRNITASDSVDMLLPTVITGYRDLVELKRPDMDVLRFDASHRDYYWSSDVSKAIGQCHRYLDVLHEVAANGLRDHPEIVAYHPRAVIVIGRSNGWPEDQLRALHGLNHRLSGVTVMTYDQLLAQGERLIQAVQPLPTNQKENAHELGKDDDIP